jgi:hypothetical protein
MSAPEPVISADSRICEIEACYADIDPKFRDSRPKAIFDEQAGAMLEIADLGLKVPMGPVCTGGLEMSRVMWATDFPQSDGTHSYTRDVIEQVTEGLSADDRNRILRGHAAALYGIAL